MTSPHEQHIIPNSGLLKSGKNLSEFWTMGLGNDKYSLLPVCREDVTMPVIDMSLPCKDDVASTVATACRDWGFFQLRNHGIPLELLEQVKACSRAVFKLPIEQKERADCRASGSRGLGYGMTTSIFSDSQMEAFHFECDPVNRIREHVGKLGLKSAELDNICGVVEEYASMAKNLASQLLELLAQGLGIADATTFTKHLETGVSSMRMHYYPPSSPQPNSVTQGLGPHHDYDLLTILLQDTPVAGLQILKGGEWFTVNPIPGALLVNVGDVLQAICNNRVHSPLHRAVLNSTDSRLSVAYFFLPALDTVISPLPELMDDENHPQIYREFTYMDGVVHYKDNKGSRKEFRSPIEHFKIVGGRELSYTSVPLIPPT